MAFKDTLVSLGEKASRFKDYGISKGGEHVARHYLRDFGQVVRFNVNTQDKNVDLEVLLNGETAPIKAEFRNYAIEHDQNKSFISFQEVTTSREWMNAVGRKFFVGRKFEIPGEYARLLEKML
ncbi:MAG: hypothetical protein ACQES5_08360 [Thermodesulfobacteriota bacterium]